MCGAHAVYAAAAALGGGTQVVRRLHCNHLLLVREVRLRGLAILVEVRAPVAPTNPNLEFVVGELLQLR